jgi:putative chitinase
MITIDQLKKICPNNKQPEELLVVLNKVLPKYEINTKERIACFLSQCGHESAQFNTLKENLNYSAQGLRNTWPKRFPSMDIANIYARNPVKIANKVYCDRMGNGSEESGDGYKFRGRGCIQLTGKGNYTKFAHSIGKSVDETVNYCETLEGALESGCFFWKTNNINRFADAKDFTGLTKAINGGLNGLEDRKHNYDIAIQVLADN